jgi:hypothetical protein
MTNTGVRRCVLALTTHVETILQALRMAKDGQRTVMVERSFDSVDVFVQADANMAANDSYNTIHEMYRELWRKSYRTSTSRRFI